MEPLRGISFNTWLAVWGAAAGVLLEDPVERDEELACEVQRAHRVRHRRVERHQDERPAKSANLWAISISKRLEGLCVASRS